jgi:hypothetical protein
MKIGLIAAPWWVNLAVLVPVVAYFYCRRGGIAITARQLAVVGVFAVAFGFVEGSVVVYLRAATGLLPGYQGTLEDVTRLAPQAQLSGELPQSLVSLEVFREAATIVMLISVALLTPVGRKSRVAIFLWAFAIWDIIYYASLWATIRWPQSIKDGDVLFLIPEPWLAPVWFPLLVSGLTLVAILLSRRSPGKA